MSAELQSIEAEETAAYVTGSQESRLRRIAMDGRVMKLLMSAMAGFVSYAYGGWYVLLDVLFFLAAADYLSGIGAAAKEARDGEGKGLTSSIMFWGGVKKLFMFSLITAAHKFDVALGQGNTLRDGTTTWYILTELLSLTENGGRMGFPIPDPVRDIIKVLRGKGSKL